MKRFVSLIMVIAVVFLFFAGCGKKTDEEEKKTIVFADVGWDSIKLNNALAGTVAEKVFGYKWIETPGSTPIMHEALIKGDIDVHMEEWTDNIPPYAADLAAGKFKELGVNFSDNMQGFYIPRYVADEYPELKTVRDLERYVQLFPDPEDSSRGIIYGGITGWEITEIMAKKTALYGLDSYYNYFESGSDAILSTAMTSAWDKRQPIVAYYWEPTWLLGKYDFVLLEDEPYDPERYQDGYGACPSVRVTVAVSNTLAETNTEFCEFLSRYRMSSAIISEALAYIDDTGASYEKAALWLLKDAHPELADEWLSLEQAQTLRAAL